jgi:hypothetical protein
MLARFADYEQALRAYSDPVRAAAQSLAGVPFVLEPSSTFSFPGYERIAPLYRYPVLTEQVGYLERALEEGIDSGVIGEAHRLDAQAAERRRLAAEAGLPVARVDLLMRMIRQHGGSLPGGQRVLFPGLEEGALQEVEAAVRHPPQVPRHQRTQVHDGNHHDSPHRRRGSHGHSRRLSQK